MPPRLTDATKRLKGTLHARPAAAAIGTPRLMRPIAPPKGLSKELQQHWRRHMAVMVANARMSVVDLLAFNELVRAAHMVDIAYEAAIAEGPTVPGDEGQLKSGAAWRSYLNSAANYRTWLSRFGLDPKSRGVIRQLPAQPGELHIVGGGGEDDDD
jgi:P27 family predicted phage terminase small subunit